MAFASLCIVSVILSNLSEEYYKIRVQFGSSIYEMRIPGSEFDDIPKWNTDELEPPLSVGKAMLFAKRWLRNSNRNPTIQEKLKPSFEGGSYVPIDIRLRPLLKDAWIYVVHFEERGPPGLALQGNEKHIEVVVDFNGTVHVPTVDQLKKPIDRE